MYVADRSNVIIHYPGTSDKMVSFVGSHMDTVPADPEQWARDPFTMERDGDKIYGRGVTDCLGHVAMLTCFFKKLAELRPTLEVGVAAVLIAKYDAAACTFCVDVHRVDVFRFGLHVVCSCCCWCFCR
jgi:acetylornithine deacetylase